MQCGRLISQDRTVVSFVVTRFSDIDERIIPFFDKYKIQGVKNQDFLDFKKVANLIKNGVHLTNKGLEEIKKIKKRN